MVLSLGDVFREVCFEGTCLRQGTQIEILGEGRLGDGVLGMGLGAHGDNNSML